MELHKSVLISVTLDHRRTVNWRITSLPLEWGIVIVNTVRDRMWRHLACCDYYDKLCLKFASHDFLLYAVYICQKSLNFIYALQIAINAGLSWPHFNWPTLYVRLSMTSRQQRHGNKCQHPEIVSVSEWMSANDSCIISTWSCC